MFYSMLNRVLSKHAPIKEKRVKREHQPDWFSDEIKKLIHERDYLKKKGYHVRYKIQRNKVTAFIKKKRANVIFITKLLKKIKIQNFFGKIKNIFL